MGNCLFYKNNNLKVSKNENKKINTFIEDITNSSQNIIPFNYNFCFIEKIKCIKNEKKIISFSNPNKYDFLINSDSIKFETNEEFNKLIFEKNLIFNEITNNKNNIKIIINEDEYFHGILQNNYYFKGVYKWSNDFYYLGYFKNNKLDGDGFIFNKNYLLKGKFLNNMLEGSSVLIDNNFGIKIECTWKNNIFSNGLIYRNGDIIFNGNKNELEILLNY